jgi:hypothetical protein
MNRKGRKVTFIEGMASSGGGGATGGLTNTELRAAPVPVSGSVTATGPATDVQLRATPLPVSGTVLTGGLTDAQLRASVVPVSGPLTDAQLRAAAVSMKQPKDTGRNLVSYFMAAGIAATAVEVMQSLTGYKGGLAVAPTVTPAVVSVGKTLRVIAVLLSFQSLATVTAAVVRLRVNLTGVAVVGSPLVAAWVIGSSAAVAGVTTTLAIPLPDGLEFPAGAGLAIGVLGLSTVGAAAASGFVTVALQGFEY